MLHRRIFAATFLFFPGLAWSQSAPARGPNGGMVVVADGHPLELAVEGQTVTIFLNDENGRLSPTHRASGRVVVQAGGQTATVNLAPAGPNRLVGQLAAPLPAGARMVFTGTMADGHRIQARFTFE